MTNVPVALEADSPVDVLGDAARAIHGPLGIHEKVVWLVDAAAALTGASVAAYLDLRGSAGGTTSALGASTSVVERLARPVVMSRLQLSPDPSEVLHYEDLAGDPRYRRFLDRVGLTPRGAALVVPVPAADGTLHGALLLGHTRADGFRDDLEAGVAALAAHLGVALDNLQVVTRLTEQEASQREMVHQLQEAVRPPLPVVEATELGVHYLPAEPGAPTGGDLYDCLLLPDGDLHLAVVDVMGKGVWATKDAVAITHALRMLVLDGCPMEDLVARAAALTVAQSPELFATVLVVRYRPADGTLQLAGGGHPPAVLVNGDEVRLVAAPGVAIGSPDAGSNEVVSVELGRSDTLVLYTDGLIEADKDVIAGLEGITAAALQTAQYPAIHQARALVERALSGAIRRDDSLALVLRRRQPPDERDRPPLAPFEYRFSPTTATVPLARHLFSDWLEHQPVDDTETSDLLLVASELCANAVRHASGQPASVALRAWADGDALVIEVEDDGEGFELEPYRNDEQPDPDASRGRGLYVVEALSDELSVTRTEGRTVARALRRAVFSAPGPA
jgi:serine phosphatase RsbU (regulator of sigma subunit)/anti-sigma regulatory factor (Ser/Thr protein kinase)